MQESIRPLCRLAAGVILAAAALGLSGCSDQSTAVTGPPPQERSKIMRQDMEEAYGSKAKARREQQSAPGSPGQ